MIKIADAFQNKKAFIPFLTAGDPDIKTSLENYKAVAEAGADLIEISSAFVNSGGRFLNSIYRNLEQKAQDNNLNQ